MKNENINYIISHWQIQESLLQQYRSIGVTHLSITATLATVILSVFENYKSAEKNLGGFESIKDQNPQAAIIFEFLILAVAIFYGFKTIYIFKSRSVSRQYNITFLQELLKKFEIDENYAGLGFEYSDHSMPLSNIMDRISPSNSPNKKRELLNEILSKKAAIEIYNLSDVALDKHKSSARKGITSSIFDIFSLVWGLIAAYTVFLVPKIYSTFFSDDFISMYSWIKDKVFSF